MKCHISSNSISLISFVISGIFTSDDAFFIQFIIVVGEQWNIFFAKKLYDAFENVYNITASALFAIVESLIRPSVSRKFFPQSLHLYLCFPLIFPLLCVFPDPQYLQCILTTPYFSPCYHKYTCMNTLVYWRTKQLKYQALPCQTEHNNPFRYQRGNLTDYERILKYLRIRIGFVPYFRLSVL